MHPLEGTMFLKGAAFSSNCLAVPELMPLLIS
jgi:hypothetical protein